MYVNASTNTNINAQLTTNINSVYQPPIFTSNTTLLGDFWNLCNSNFQSSGLLNFLQSFEFISTCSLFFMILFFLILNIFAPNDDVKIVSYSIIFISIASWLCINSFIKQGNLDNLSSTLSQQQSYNNNFTTNMESDMKKFTEAIQTKCSQLDNIISNAPDISTYVSNYNSQNSTYQSLVQQVQSVNVALAQQQNISTQAINDINNNYITIQNMANQIKGSLNIVDFNGFIDTSISDKLNEIQTIYNPSNIIYPYDSILNSITTQANSLSNQTDSINKTINSIEKNLQNIRKSVYPMKELLHNLDEVCFNFYLKINSDGKLIFNTNTNFNIEDFLLTKQYFLSDNSAVKTVLTEQQPYWLCYFLLQDYSAYQGEYAAVGYTENNEVTILYVVSLNTGQVFFPNQKYILINSQSQYNLFSYNSITNTFTTSQKDLSTLLTNVQSLITSGSVQDQACAAKSVLSGVLGYSLLNTEMTNQNVYKNNITSPTAITLDGILLQIDSQNISNPYMETYIPVLISDSTSNLTINPNIALNFTNSYYWTKYYNSLNNVLLFSTNNSITTGTITYDLVPNNIIKNYENIQPVITATNLSQISSVDSTLLTNISSYITKFNTNRRQVKLIYNQTNLTLTITLLNNGTEISSIMITPINHQNTSQIANINGTNYQYQVYLLEQNGNILNYK